MSNSRLPRVATLPEFYLVSQRFPDPVESNLKAAVIRELKAVIPDPSILKNKIVGITMPSRGIADIAEVIRHTVVWLLPYCGSVRILTAMGSHGNGTSEGELAMAASRGVTDATVGARVYTNMATRHIATVNGVEVHLSEDVCACDFLLLVNRIKQHTDIDWPARLPAGHYGLESGFAKILALGCSKLMANRLHVHMFGIGLGAAIETSARRVIEGGPVEILGGLGIIENASEQTAFLAGVPAYSADQFFAAEADLLRRSIALMPTFPCSKFDLLHCRTLSKRVSGQGMHTHLIGRGPYGHVQGVPWHPNEPSIYTIIGSELGEGGGGNAIGVGNCEFITRRFADAIDREHTILNCANAFTPLMAHIPAVMESDRDAFEVALALSPSTPRGPRVVCIANTMHLGRILISGALLEEVAICRNVTVHGEAFPLRFDPEGYLELDALLAAQ